MHIVQLVTDGFGGQSDPMDIQFQGSAYECIDFMKKKYQDLENDNNFGGRWLNNNYTEIEVYQKSNLQSTGQKYRIDKIL
jgi:hypothetical protein